MAMLVALTFAFPSCNVEMELGNNTLEYRERTAYLCSYDWQDDWYDDYGLHHFQVLRFYTFTWDWYDAFYTSIRLNYGGGDYSYMDNIRLGEGRMECLLDGAAVCFYSY